MVFGWLLLAALIPVAVLVFRSYLSPPAAAVPAQAGGVPARALPGAGEAGEDGAAPAEVPAEVPGAVHAMPGSIESVLTVRHDHVAAPPGGWLDAFVQPIDPDRSVLPPTVAPLVQAAGTVRYTKGGRRFALG